MEIEYFDKTLMFMFNEREKIPIMKHYSLGNLYGTKNDHQTGEAILIQLIRDGLANSIYREGSTGTTGTTLYTLTFEAIYLCHNLPEEYTGHPYSFFLREKENNSERERASKKLIDDTNKALKESTESSKIANDSLVTTNASVRTLNTMTKKYYWIYLSLTALTACFIFKQAFFTDGAKDLQPIYKQFQQIQQSQDSMKQSQKEMSASLRSMADSISSLKKNAK